MHLKEIRVIQSYDCVRTPKVRILPYLIIFDMRTENLNLMNELQKEINDFFMLHSSESVKEMMTELFGMAIESEQIELTEVNERSNLFFLTQKRIPKLITLLEKFQQN